MRAGILGSVLALGAALAACDRLFDDTPKVDASAADAIARAAVENGEIPSVAYALVRGGRVIHEGAHGFADKADAREATPRTPYPLASLTKPLLATALMVLVERGIVDLDQPLLDYFAGHRSPDASYTVRQVLSHTGGLATYARIYWKDRDAPVVPFERRVAHYGFVAQPPGTVFEYSNLGYGLLGELVEVSAQARLASFLHDAVFRPLGMRDAVLVDDFSTPAGAARKYGADGHELPETYNDTPGAGNAWASARDLARFASFHLGADGRGTPVLSAAARRAMQAPAQVAALHPYYGGAGYGLGWYVRGTVEPVVWHEGGMPGASTILVLLPQQQLAAAVLINVADANAKAQEIAGALLRAAAPGSPPVRLVPTEGFAPYDGKGPHAGRWSGTVDVDGLALPWTLELDRAGKAHAEFPEPGGKPGARQAAYATFVHGPLLLATFPGRLPGRDVAPGDGIVLLRLMRRDDELTGFAVAYASARGLEHLHPFRARLARRPG